MKKIYRFVFRGDSQPELYEFLQISNEWLKGKVAENHHDFSVFEIAENARGWDFVSQFVDQEQKPQRLRVSVRLEYSEAEMDSAEWFKAWHTGNFGYPKPEDKWLNTCFTHKNFEPDSGFRYEQIASYRISQNPRNKKTFVGLHWVFDDLFVRSEIIPVLEMNQIRGWKAWPVMLNQPDEPSDVVTQLEATSVLDFYSENTTVWKLYDSEMGIKKYYRKPDEPVIYSSRLLDETMDIVLSREVFGDGHVAARDVLVSRRFVDLIQEHSWTGLRVHPVQIAD